MPSYFDTKNKNVKKFLEHREKINKFFPYIFSIFIIAIFIFLIKGALSLLVLCIGGFLFWYFDNEITELKNRFAILDEDISELYLKNFINKGINKK